MNILCTDNRFKLIEKYKQKLIDGTNIETAQDEMAVIDDILFRFWQMGWLDKLDAIEELSHNFVSKHDMEIILEEVTKPQWIPVTERLPDVFKHVLVNIPGMALLRHPTVQEAFREKNGMWYSNGFRYEEDEITHWMPLPEPPKMEEEE